MKIFMDTGIFNAQNENCLLEEKDPLSDSTNLLLFVII